MPVVVQMTFNLPAPADDFRDSVREQAPMFNSVDGLRWKMWLVNTDEGGGTGIYMFDLGRLGWPLRRIEQEIGVRRETAGAYLKAAGVPVRDARHRQLRAKPASAAEVSTDSVLTQAPPAAAAPGSPDRPAPSAPPERALSLPKIRAGRFSRRVSTAVRPLLRPPG